MELKAAQHVSGVLNDKQSRHGHGGYQTLCYTRDMLSEDEVRQLEHHAQHGGASADKAFWQSYAFGARRHAVTRVVPVATPDQFGRRGRFFTHTLVFDQPGDIPFDVLRSGAFFSTLEQVLASEAAKTGNAPAVHLGIGAKWVNEVSGLAGEWAGEQLNRLYILASDPRRLIEAGQHVVLVGSEAQVLDALKIIASLTRPQARKTLTFDTGSASDETAQGVTFRGRGASATEAERSLYVVDCARRQVTLPESSPLKAAALLPEQLSPGLARPVSAYLDRPTRWMLSSLLERKYATFMGEAVYQALLREREARPTKLDIELLNPFAEAHCGLGLLLALRSGDEGCRLRALARIRQKDEYVRLAKALKNSPDFEPWQAFSPDWMPTWFDLFRGDYDAADIVNSVARVAEHGSEHDRQQIEYIHERLDTSQRRALSSWLKSSPHRFDHLQAALDRPDAAGSRSDGAVASLWRRLRHPFNR